VVGLTVATKTETVSNVSLEDAVMIRHIVLLRWSETATEASKLETLRALQGLATEVPNTRDLRVGTDFAGRGTFDVALTIDFDSRDDLNEYLEHPSHRQVVATNIKETVVQSEIIDFEHPSA
jgi:hypothetical protein